MSLQIVRCNHRRRYNMRRDTNPWLRNYRYFVPCTDQGYPNFKGYWTMSCHSDFHGGHAKEIETGGITNVRLRFLPIVKQAFVGYDSERRRFVVRGRSPMLGYWNRKYMFGNRVRMRDDKTVGKRRTIKTMRPWNPRGL